jgi:hypothetical protein
MQNHARHSEGLTFVTHTISEQEPEQALRAPTLYIAIDPDASFKVGTCAHCVLEEPGRPKSAWDALDDRALDFERETYFALLARLGIVITARDAYVCP